MADLKIKAVVLDLFDTLVKWDPGRLPTIELHGRQVRSTLPWLLPKLRSLAGESFDFGHFLESYHAVMTEITHRRVHDGVEITCHERFARTLAMSQLIPEVDVDALAEDLTRIHMAGIRSVTFAPPEHLNVVRLIAQRYRLGLLSNFDDSRTGREIVADTGLGDLFEAILISADVGLRKPNPEIFQRMLAMLEIGPNDMLFVGDTPREDVAGARRAGIPVVWLKEGKDQLPADVPTPDFTLGKLTELPSLLGL